MSLRFISDLHLDEKRPDITRAFFHYLQNLPTDTEALYILGDFFEVWIGDDDDATLNQQICAALNHKSASGLPIFFMHGNRDFLVGKLFELRTGCILLPDPFVLEYQGERFLLMHGDSLCLEDIDYQKFRAQIRSPQMQAELLKKSLDERRAIAKELRDNSKMANSNKSADIMDVTPAEVERVMTTHRVSTLIHGHTHRPAIHDLTVNSNQAQRIVLGDWGSPEHDHRGWEFILDHHNRQLRSFPLTD